MIQNKVLSLLMMPCVVSSLSFVPQPQRGCLDPSVRRVNRNARPHHVLAAANDDITTSTTELTADDNGDVNINSKKGKMSSVFSESVQSEAREVLEKVGWAGVAPDLDNPEQPMTSDDPFVQNIDAGIREDFGVGLDDLLNPAKVVNLERELYQLREELQSTSDRETIESIATSIEKKRKKIGNRTSFGLPGVAEEHFRGSSRDQLWIQLRHGDQSINFVWWIRLVLLQQHGHFHSSAGLLVLVVVYCPLFAFTPSARIREESIGHRISGYTNR